MSYLSLNHIISFQFGFWFWFWKSAARNFDFNELWILSVAGWCTISLSITISRLASSISILISLFLFLFPFTFTFPFPFPFFSLFPSPNPFPFPFHSLFPFPSLSLSHFLFPFSFPGSISVFLFCFTLHRLDGIVLALRIRRFLCLFCRSRIQRRSCGLERQFLAYASSSTRNILTWSAMWTWVGKWRESLKIT